MSSRTYNMLTKAGFRTWADVWAKTDAELSEIPFFGEKSLKEVRTLERAFPGPDPMRIPEKVQLVAHAWATAEHREVALSDMPKARAVLEALGIDPD